jgi:eukaryotic-like serine/threonine-protein kinase
VLFKELTPERAAQLSQLLDEALDLPPDGRSAWLASLRERDAVSHRMIAELLESLSAAGAPKRLETRDFLNRRIADALVAEPSIAGKTFGPYRILEPLGRGGMGSVWLAERADGLFSRRVALKLVHSTFSGSSFVERFARERSILGALTHPCIARLLDAGFGPEGQPYLAIEYVDGVPLTTHCDAKQSPVRARVELAAQVLSAVQHAHRNLVVHRDLKPSNILVTSDGQVRLLDFGIAKLLTDGEARETELTRLGGRALTPDYASPEQIAGDPITIASDVYSLGIVLYELLCGSRPYLLKRESRQALEQAILSVDPIKPSETAITEDAGRARSTTARKLAQTLQGDLDTIVLKAIKKDPAERYATADAFIQDLERYLSGEPVLARPDSTAYRFRKFVIRHRLPVAAAVVAGLALVAGATIAVREARIARDQEHIAERESGRSTAFARQALLETERAKTEAARAQTFAQESRRAANTAERERQRADSEAVRASKEARAATLESQKARSVQGFLLDIFRANSERQADPVKARQTTARELLDFGTSRIKSSLTTAPETKEALLDTLATMHTELGLDVEAAALNRERVEIARRTYGARDPRTVDALIAYATSLFPTSERSKIPPLLEEAGGALDATGDRSSKRRAQLLQAYATYYQTGEIEKMRTAAEAAVNIYRGHHSDDPDAPLALYTLARAYSLAGDYGAAEPVYRETLETMRRFGRSVSSTAVKTLVYLGESQRFQLKMSDAERNYRLALDTARKIGAETSLDVIECQMNLGTFLQNTSHNKEGLLLLGQAVEKLERTREGAETFYANAAAYQYGHALLMTGRLEEAKDRIFSAIEARKSRGPSVGLANMFASQGFWLMVAGRYEEADRAFVQAYEMQVKTRGMNRGAINNILLLQSQLRAAEENPAAALAKLREIVPSERNPEPGLNREAIRRAVQQAIAHLQLGNTTEAARQAQAALDDIRRAGATDYVKPLAADAELTLGQAQHRADDLNAARPSLERALALREENDDPLSPWLAEAQIALADCLADIGNVSEARGLIEKATAIHASHVALGEHFKAPLRRVAARLASR